MHCNGLKLSGVLEVFLSLHDFWVKKCKNQFFEENKRYECSFIEFKYRWLQTCLVDLKNTKHLTFCWWQIFLWFFWKLIIFQIFWNFRKSSAAYTKIIVCVLFYVNMLDKPPCNLMSPFSNDIILLIWYPLPIWTWNFKGHLNGIC